MGNFEIEENHQNRIPGQIRMRRRLRNLRILMILPFAVTALILTPLHFLKKSAEVEIDLKVSQVSFDIGEPGATGWFNSIRTRSLTLLSFKRIESIPGGLEIATGPNDEIPQGWQPIAAQPLIKIVPENDFASITLQNVKLNSLDIQPDSFVTLSAMPNASNSFKLGIAGAEAAGRIVAGKTLLFSCNYCKVDGLPADQDLNSKYLRIKGQRERVLSFWGRSESTTVALEPHPEAALVEHNIRIKGNVDFTRLVEKKRESTIIGDEGKISFSQLDKKLAVRSDEFVILDELDNFSIKTFHINNGIDIVFHGRVGRLATGTAGFVKDRLPSYLQWLYARESWLLYLTALASIGTSLLAILKRLKILNEAE